MELKCLWLIKTSVWYGKWHEHSIKVLINHENNVGYDKYGVQVFVKWITELWRLRIC